MKYPTVIALLIMLPFGIVPGSSAQELSQKADVIRSQATNNIEIYCDFRCPVCGSLFLSMLPAGHTNGPNLNYTFRHFPFHSGSEELAIYFEAVCILYPASKEAVIFDLYRFRKPGDSTNLDTFLQAFSVVHGFNHTAILNETKARDVLLNVAASQRAAVELGITGTPSLVVNGRLINEMTIEKIAQLVRANEAR